jgi:hypothetical protein
MKWEVHGRRSIYTSPWVELWLEDVEIPGGERFDYRADGATLIGSPTDESESTHSAGGRSRTSPRSSPIGRSPTATRS